MLTLSPLPPTFGPLELRVPTGWRTTAVFRVDDEAMEWDGHRMDFADIDRVAYATSERSLNLVQRQVTRRVHVGADDTTIAIEVGTQPFGPRSDVPHHQLYRTAVDVLHARVEPRLRAELRRRIAAGRMMTVGGLGLARAGVTLPAVERVMTWDRLPGAIFEGDRVRIRAAVGHHDEAPWDIPMLAPNAVLLPELLAECAEVFS